MPFIEHRLELRRAAGQQVQPQPGERRVMAAKGREVLPVGERATNALAAGVAPRETRGHVIQLAPQVVSRRLGLCARLVEQNTRKRDGEEAVATYVVIGTRDHAQRS